MGNKNTILTVIVIALFGVSGAVLYYGIFNKPGVSSAPIEVNQKSIVNLLPYGEDLPFEVLEKRAGVNPPLVYKQVNPAQDVGVQLKDILKNAAPDAAGGGPNQIF